MSRFPSGSSRRSESFLPVADPRPKGLRKKNWSQFASHGPNDFQLGFVGPVPLRASFNKEKVGIHPSPAKRVPVLASHPAALWPGDHPDRAFTGLTARTPASLKGQLTRRIYAYLVSSWLTNAIDRIVKELPLNQTRGSARNALL